MKIPRKSARYVGFTAGLNKERALTCKKQSNAMYGSRKRWGQYVSLNMETHNVEKYWMSLKPMNIRITISAAAAQKYLKKPV